MTESPKPLDHMEVLRMSPGPTITGKIVERTDGKIALLTKFGLYEVRSSDISDSVANDDGTESVTITRGAKIVFSRLIDGDSLMVRSRANLARMAQEAKQLHGALHRALGQPPLPAKAKAEDCPMCDCVDCCECPVVDCGDDDGGMEGGDGDGGERSAGKSLATKYYDEKIGRSESSDYRKN